MRGFHAANAPWHDPMAATPPAPTATAVMALVRRHVGVRGTGRREADGISSRGRRLDVEVVRATGRSDHGDAAIASEGRSHQSPRRRNKRKRSNPKKPQRRRSIVGVVVLGESVIEVQAGEVFVQTVVDEYRAVPSGRIPSPFVLLFPSDREFTVRRGSLTSP